MTTKEQVKHAGSHYIVQPEAYPNCRLCHMQAAAPDLLDAAKAAVENCRCSIKERMSGHHIDCNAPVLEAAIAKAELK